MNFDQILREMKNAVHTLLITVRRVWKMWDPKVVWQIEWLELGNCETIFGKFSKFSQGADIFSHVPKVQFEIYKNLDLLQLHYASQITCKFMQPVMR